MSSIEPTRSEPADAPSAAGTSALEPSPPSTTTPRRPHWVRAPPDASVHNNLHASLPNGVQVHDWLGSYMPPPTELPRGNRTAAGFLHYPRLTPHNGYGTPTGGGTDATTCMMARAVQQVLPAGVVLPFLEQYDYFADLDGPRELKVGSVDYSWRKHFWKGLNAAQQQQWRSTKVRALASVMVDEILERGRVGMDAFVAGDCPLEVWPELLTDAAAIARKEASAELGWSVLYDIAFPPNLPPLQPLKEGEAAPAVGEFELQHPSGAAPGRFMSLCHRTRLDAALSWLHRDKLNGAQITYFQSLSKKYGDYSEAEVRVLQADAKAREGGYDGPSPLEEGLLTEAQAAARTAAISRGQSQRAHGKKRLRVAVAAETDPDGPAHKEQRELMGRGGRASQKTEGSINARFGGGDRAPTAASDAGKVQPRYKDCTEEERALFKPCPTHPVVLGKVGDECSHNIPPDGIFGRRKCRCRFGD